MNVPAQNDTYDGMFEVHDRQRGRRQRNGEYLAEILGRYIAPRSVVDVGCGLGFFLKAMQARGAEVQGVDADWVKPLVTEIDKDAYVYRDLEDELALDKTYDLASSLEVAEHLSPERGPGFVADLCKLSDIVLFSAAIPGQRGSGHVNLQWQSYWAGLFADQGFLCYDPVRRRMAAHDDGFEWFAQNTLLYVREGTDLPAGLEEHLIAPKAADYVGLPFFQRKQSKLRKRAEKAEKKTAG